MSPKIRLRKPSSKLLGLIFLLLPIIVLARTNDQYLPYHIQADTIIYNQNLHTTIYQGHVHATQGTPRLTGDKVVVYNSKVNNKIILIVATGQPAHYTTLPDNQPKRLFTQADTIKYYPLKNQVLLLKRAKVTQDENLFTGPHIWYDISKQVVVSTSPEGHGKTTVVIEPQGSK